MKSQFRCLGDRSEKSLITCWRAAKLGRREGGQRKYDGNTAAGMNPAVPPSRFITHPLHHRESPRAQAQQSAIGGFRFSVDSTEQDAAACEDHVQGSRYPWTYSGFERSTILYLQDCHFRRYVSYTTAMDTAKTASIVAQSADAPTKNASAGGEPDPAVKSNEDSIQGLDGIAEESTEKNTHKHAEDEDQGGQEHHHDHHLHGYRLFALLGFLTLAAFLTLLDASIIGVVRRSMRIIMC